MFHMPPRVTVNIIKGVVNDTEEHKQAMQKQFGFPSAEVCTCASKLNEQSVVGGWGGRVLSLILNTHHFKRDFYHHNSLYMSGEQLYNCESITCLYIIISVKYKINNNY